MATADSVKSKLQELIYQANATTGKTDADLTAAVGRLIAGFGQGGGGAPFTNTTTLGVYEATEDVSAIQIDWLTEWNEYDLVIFKPSITLSASDWLYINTNAVTKTKYFPKATYSGENHTFAFFKNGGAPNSRFRSFAEYAEGKVLSGTADDGIIYVYLQPYTSTVVFKSGSKVEVIGVIFQ